MRRMRADLHIHTALSPCAAPEMTPAAIVRTAAARGLEMIAVCDHNSADNAAATQQAASHMMADTAAPRGRGMTVLAGIEVSTREEVHVLGLFPDARAALEVSQNVRETLPELRDPPRWMGEQRRLDAEGRVLSTETKLLAAASSLSLAKVVALIHAHAGLAIAAHVDRPSFSVVSQLGSVPTDVPWDALEVSAAALSDGRWRTFGNLGLPLVASSDSHCLDEIGSVFCSLVVQAVSFDELRLALTGQQRRRCCLA